jgi:hypothetical protein
VSDRPGLVVPVVVVPEQRFQLRVAAGSPHFPHVAAGEVERPRDPLVPESVRVGAPRGVARVQAAGAAGQAE